MTITTSLFNLQELDADIERGEQELSALRQRQARNPELESAEKRLADLQTLEQQTASAQRSLEADLSAVETKIKRDQTRMYSGQIVDARELASLERELEHYGTQRDALESRVLEGMERRETLQQQIDVLTTKTLSLRDQWSAGQPDLNHQIGERQETVVRLRGERERVASTLDARSIQVYTRLRASSGHAVATLKNGVCGECRVAVPQKDVQHVHSGALVTCPNCARILHVRG